MTSVSNKLIKRMVKQLPKTYTHIVPLSPFLSTMNLRWNALHIGYLHLLKKPENVACCYIYVRMFVLEWDISHSFLCQCTLTSLIHSCFICLTLTPLFQTPMQCCNLFFSSLLVSIFAIANQVDWSSARPQVWQSAGLSRLPQFPNRHAELDSTINWLFIKVSRSWTSDLPRGGLSYPINCRAPLWGPEAKRMSVLTSYTTGCVCVCLGKHIQCMIEQKDNHCIFTYKIFHIKKKVICTLKNKGFKRGVSQWYHRRTI